MSGVSVPLTFFSYLVRADIAHYAPLYGYGQHAQNKDHQLGLPPAPFEDNTTFAAALLTYIQVSGRRCLHPYQRVALGITERLSSTDFDQL